ncbi:MAG: hypothetical protein IT208_16965 [Chthonomonadales bacterium]|nr:hypothetical protein [Chthonomonadales bacterium]
MTANSSLGRCAAAAVLAAAICAGPGPELSGAAPRETPAMTPYGVATKPWPAELGHHRALVRVHAAAPAVRVRIPWRRRDRDPAAKETIVLAPSGGQRVTNVVRIEVRREHGDLAFEPIAGPGLYEVYYLPYSPETTQYYYARGYTPPADTAKPDWAAANGLGATALGSGAWEALPGATVERFEARTAFDSFYPMEVVASADEVAALVSAHPKPYLLFPEDRAHAIRMADDLPVRWTRSGPSDRFGGEALRGEFYPFQIGVYAARQPLEDLALVFSDLKSAGGAPAIPAAALRCFNLGGVDTDGVPFRKRVDVPQGRVQALWIGVDVPADAAPGDYAGEVTVSARNAPASRVAVRLTVRPGGLADRGDSELWRYSRLRWLDSTAGIDDEPVAPYTPLRVSRRTVHCLGRSVRFGADGLPASIRSGSREVLAAPIRMVAKTEAGPVGLGVGRAAVVRRTAGSVTWEATRDGADALLRCAARMEFDGHLAYRVALRAKRALRLSDARLELPVRADAAGYFMGAGRKGGRRPDRYEWRWTTPHDSFWIGDATAGVHCELRGGAYHGPLLNLFQPAPPASWHNGGRGGVALEPAVGGTVTVRAFSGARELAAGEELVFEFALLVTPVKPLDTAMQFRTRYYHDGAEPVVDRATLDAGVNVMNVHHANAINPYINYPFLTTASLGGFVHEWQGRGMKVKLYYTVRELTNYVAELWALRSLGTEVLAGGDGGGFPWLREHLVDGYTPQWYVPFPDGTADASILTSGESRWYNYYVEGLGWLVRNLRIDGLYLDDVSYDRRILKRMRKVMETSRPGGMIDLHSNTAFSIGPANQYAEFLPYVDRIWFGESFRYEEEPPDYWLTEISGIPFGLMGEMLQEPTNRWRGMIYGMTARLTWGAAQGPPDPRPVYRLWNAFGIDQARMVGYWDPRCPVRTGRDDVLATVYRRPGRALIALASWAPERADVRLAIDFRALGLDPARTVLHAPAVQDFQPERQFALDDTVPVDPKRGWCLLLEERAAAGSSRRVSLAQRRRPSGAPPARAHDDSVHRPGPDGRGDAARQ